MRGSQDLTHLQEGLSRAKRAYRAGNYLEAVSLCRDLLARSREDSAVLRLLGLSLAECGELEEGLRTLQSAVVVHESEGSLYSDLATLLSRAGRGPEAARMLLRAIVLSPVLADGYANSAAILSDLGDSQMATDHAHRALILAPLHCGALVNLGNLLRRFGRPAQAFLAFRRASVVEPSRPEAWYGIAMSGQESGKLEAASRAGCWASRLRWRPAIVELAYGAILMDIRQFPASVVSSSKVVALQPSMEPGYSNLTMGLANSGNANVGVVVGERAVLLNDQSWSAHLNLGIALKETARLAESLRSWSRARALGHDTPDLCFLEAINYLLLGNFERGWHRYEARWETARNAVLLGPLRWRKSSPSEFSGASTRRVLVWAEQGLGDEVMFAGLLGEFRGLCGEMLVQVEPRLKSLFQRSMIDVKVFDNREVIAEELYDEQIPMGSLGKWLRPTRESFEGKGGRYLRAQEGLGAKLRSELGVKAGERLIGLSWRSASAETGAVRSLALKELVGALGGVPGVRFVNLQYGDVRQEIAAVTEELGVEVLSHPGVDNREDLEGLAGLIEGCDLVVSVGNATAHLSGALGQKTWVLLPYVAGWRWLHEGSTCPWYRSVRLLRQAAPGCWTEALDRLASSLRDSWIQSYRCS